MSKWMKLSALVMVLILMLSMIGCGKKETAATESAGTTAPSEDGETTQTEAQPETTAPDGETEPTAAPTIQEQPATQEQSADQETTADQESYEELGDELEDIGALEDELGDMGAPPVVTVKWETYENMSDSEKAAYEACFTNQSAFDMWYEMTMTNYEMEEIYDEGALNLKAILSMMLGEELE